MTAIPFTAAEVEAAIAASLDDRQDGPALLYVLPHEADPPADDIQSAEPPVAVGRTNVGPLVRFLSARDLAAQTTARPEFSLGPWAIRGAITELDGRPKAAGKTTLLAYMIRAKLEGQPWLGHDVAPGPVVLLSEQPPASLRVVLERAGLLEHDDLRILLWNEARGVPWPELVDEAQFECRRIGARDLIVDTLPQFAGLRGDAENDAGVALLALEPLQSLASAGLAVIVARHDRKAGGEVGDSGRGSSAFTGAVDIVLALRRVAEQRPTIRKLEALSRFDETPTELLIELTDEGYVSLGTSAAVAFDDTRRTIGELLDRAENGLTMKDLEAALPDVERTTIQSAIKVLQAADQVIRSGRGVRGDPYRWDSPAGGFNAFDSGSPLRGESIQRSNAAPWPDVVEIDGQTWEVEG